MLFTALSFHIILPGLFQTIYLMSIPISLKNKHGNEKSCWRFGKDCFCVCRGFSLYGKLLPNHFTAWYILVYLIKLVGCIWDKFDLEDTEKPILSFVRFYTLSWSNCQKFVLMRLRLLLHFREGNLNIDLNYRCLTSIVKYATACLQGLGHKSHFRFSYAKMKKLTLANISLDYSCLPLWNTDVL